jgi:hypothetical protein
MQERYSLRRYPNDVGSAHVRGDMKSTFRVFIDGIVVSCARSF